MSQPQAQHPIATTIPSNNPTNYIISLFGADGGELEGDVTAGQLLVHSLERVRLELAVGLLLRVKVAANEKNKEQMECVRK